MELDALLLRFLRFCGEIAPVASEALVEDGGRVNAGEFVLPPYGTAAAVTVEEIGAAGTV